MTMSGGEISGNYAVVEGTERYAVHRGGGVWIAGGGFTMSGGKISGNLCDDILDRGGEALGGGVYFAGDRMFMNGSAEISGNTATKGGGVYLAGTQQHGDGRERVDQREPCARGIPGGGEPP